VGRLKRQEYELRTFAEDLAQSISAERLRANTITWPNTRWAKDPVGFAHDVLGLRCWSRQSELVESVTKHSRVSCRSGRRTGKSTSIAILALWRYCSFARGDVLLTSATSAQLDGILWSEVRRLHALSGLCADCNEQDPNQQRPCPHSAIIDGICGATSKSGIKSPDPRYPRRVRGKTARKVEGLLGFGSPECLILADECSGLDDSVFSALTGMLAGGGALLLCGNPTKSVGYFARTFKMGTWHQLQIASTETPNYQLQREVIPGLASYQWVISEIEEHGPDSAHVAVHIKGDFATQVQKRPFSHDVYTAAVARNPTAPAVGLLHIGMDVALSSARDGRHDDSCFAVRRGLRWLELDSVNNLNEQALLERLLALIDTHAMRGEVPVVNIDRQGTAGFIVGEALKVYLHHNPRAFNLWSIRESDRPKRQIAVYNRHRDELFGNLEKFVRDGGGLPDDPMLEEELAEVEFESNATGKLVLIPKDHIKSAISRSPDRMDSIALACWQAPNTDWCDGPKPSDGARDPSPGQQRPAFQSSMRRPPPQQRDGRGAISPYGNRRR